ncbi:unnamed protein product [Symbiodinium necroappetens]|uniref:Uncharacterized protein n=1 Tax=Symbiodinium necroappetens TaxID=1628268 RepID=A0A812QT98_9DINO|nr:unnamed protein product [Symbiodinium sp. KB8]CAE7243928.1 unnamed protein product [Symbiodinium microadriaticum]CAE7403192.1 unnamed protein product [Symbiodinium necroappetens]|mmetsp:Transcript_59403/g.141696  ORF Transcript_59403/g.141696 Transcript_59403/m.141696 type:complete len:164 (+) Transcript_59403:63-554(+)
MVAREPLRQHSKPRQARRGARSGKAPDLCAALVAELLIASPKNRTRRLEGSMLPSVCEHRAEGHRSRADSWSETQSSDVALEMELEDIARLRERLGDTLSTQEVLAQQVRPLRKDCQAKEQRRPEGPKPSTNPDSIRAGRGKLPPLPPRAFGLQARKAIDRVG